MIKSFKFANFDSFREQTELNLEVNQNAPQTDAFLEHDGIRLNKVSALFGPNGSGKTNTLRAIEFVRWFITRSFASEEKGINQFSPFELTKDSPSRFDVEFYVGEKFYSYHLLLNSTQVLEENLKSRRSTRLVDLFNRSYEPKIQQYAFRANSFGMENSLINQVRPNASIISTLAQFNHPEATLIKDYWDRIQTKLPTLNRYRDSGDILAVSQMYDQNLELFEKVKSLIRGADVGLSDILIRKFTPPDVNKSETMYFPYGLHRTKEGVEFNLPFFKESNGTQSFYSILAYILPVLETGSVLLLDEIESDLHPDMLPYILNLFISKESNPKNAQIIFTSHMTTLMTQLVKYQIFLTAKNENCVSELWRLDDINGIRIEDNLFSKYSAGAYGATPNIDY